MAARPAMSSRSAAPAGPGVVCVAACVPRDAARALVRRAFPRRRARLVVVRAAADLEAAFRRELVDAAIVDVAHPTADTWRAVALAREFPSAPFFGMTPYGSGDGATIAQCAASDLADVVAEGVDDAVLFDLVVRDAFRRRFARSLHDAPPVLRLTEPLQQRAWRMVVAGGGCRVPTEAVARMLGLTREHLSRSFAVRGAPNLKRTVDLVRLLAAAELAKNPGFAPADVATVLRFSSTTQLATVTRRLVGAGPASLARLRAVDLVRRFAALLPAPAPR